MIEGGSISLHGMPCIFIQHFQGAYSKWTFKQASQLLKLLLCAQCQIESQHAAGRHRKESVHLQQVRGAVFHGAHIPDCHTLAM